jgi:hypothetical protein
MGDVVNVGEKQTNIYSESQKHFILQASKLIEIGVRTGPPFRDGTQHQNKIPHNNAHPIQSRRLNTTSVHMEYAAKTNSISDAFHLKIMISLLMFDD